MLQAHPLRRSTPREIEYACVMLDNSDEFTQITTGEKDMNITLYDVTLQLETGLSLGRAQQLSQGQLSIEEFENVSREYGWVPVEGLIELDYRAPRDYRHIHGRLERSRRDELRHHHHQSMMMMEREEKKQREADDSAFWRNLYYSDNEQEELEEHEANPNP